LQIDVNAATIRKFAKAQKRANKLNDLADTLKNWDIEFTFNIETTIYNEEIEEIEIEMHREGVNAKNAQTKEFEALFKEAFMNIAQTVQTESKKFKHDTSDDCTLFFADGTPVNYKYEIHG
jgi:hypothetical protein